MLKRGVFTSSATCTDSDRNLENEINRRLAGRGKVSAYTILDPDGNRYGITYSHNGRHQTFVRQRFDVDIDALIGGLNITAMGMENVSIPRGWVYDPDEADVDPFVE